LSFAYTSATSLEGGTCICKSRVALLQRCSFALLSVPLYLSYSEHTR